MSAIPIGERVNLHETMVKPKGRFVRRKDILPNPESTVINEVPYGYRYLGPVNPDGCV
jgi:hypothetical protein